MSENIFDLLIIGGGPAGISAADAAESAGLDYLVLEKGLIANTIYRYPVGRTVFSTPNELEFRPGDLQPCREKPTREELLSYYVKFALDRDLRLHTEEEVTALEPFSDGFKVVTSRGTYESKSVLVAVGAMAYPRRLGVAGEKLPKVHHLFVEPYPFVRKNVIVIGGGNSAAEAALFLSQEGAYTTLVIWKADWENTDPKKGAIKHWVRTPLEEELAAGRLTLCLFRQIEEITETSVKVKMEDGETRVLPNDAVFVLIGADADVSLLRKAGVELKQEGLNTVPVYDPNTFETNVSGLFVAGHFTYSRHIKEAIAVPRRIVPVIAERLRTTEHSVA